MRRTNVDGEENADFDDAEALEEAGEISRLELWRWRRILRTSMPKAPELVVVHGSLEESVAVNVARYDQCFDSLRGRCEAGAAAFKRAGDHLERESRRIARDLPVLKQYIEVAGPKRALGIGGLLFVAVAVLLSGTAVFLSINTVALAAYNATAVKTVEQGRTLAAVALLGSGVLEAIHILLEAPLYRKRFALFLATVTAMAVTVWIVSITGLYGDSLAGAKSIDIGALTDLSGAANEVAQATVGSGVTVFRAALLAEVAGAATLWIAVSTFLKGYAPITRPEHPDVTEARKRQASIESVRRIFRDLEAAFTGRVNEVTNGRRVHEGEARSSYLKRMGGGSPDAA